MKYAIIYGSLLKYMRNEVFQMGEIVVESQQ